MIHHKLRWAAGAALGILLTVTLTSPPAVAADLEPGEFDPAAWGALVARYAGPDGVDYAAWKKAGTGELDAFLDAAAKYDLGSILGKEPRAAFLMNAYNAWAVRQILGAYPVTSVRDIDGFFDRNTRLIAGEERTLDGIESTLAQIMKHRPVVLLALAPGAKGMPRLSPIPYTSADLIQLSREISVEYLNGPGGLRYDRDANVLHLPPVFEKYADAFAAGQTGLTGFLAEYLTLSDMMAVSQNDPKTVTAEVDWALDDAPAKPDGK